MKVYVLMGFSDPYEKHSQPEGVTKSKAKAKAWTKKAELNGYREFELK